MNSLSNFSSTSLRKQQFAASVGSAPNIAWFKFNGDIYDYRFDNIGKKEATVNVVGNSPEQYVPYKANMQAYLFDGSLIYNTGNYIIVSSIQCCPTMTFSCWINIRTFNVYSRICDYGFFRLHIRNNSTLWFNDTYALRFKTGFQNIWKHIAFTIDGPTFILYENGVPLQTIIIATALASRPRTTTSKGYIGHSMGADQNTGGMFSDFRIYDRVLTSSEIMGLFTL
jgi:hypothetical protein